MGHINRLFCLVLGALVLWASPSMAGRQRVEIFCDKGDAPYSYVEDGEAAGIYTEILKRAFSRMPDYEVVITPVSWEKGMRLMEEGLGFALYPPYFRPKTLPFMDYPASVLDEGYALMGSPDLKKKSLKVWPDDFKGLRVGVPEGEPIPEMEKARAMGVIFEPSDSNHSGLLKLASGQTDVYINDMNQSLWLLKQMKTNGEYDESIHGKLASLMEISKEQGYLGFTNKDKGRFGFRNDFIRKFVAEIQEMKENGEIEEILNAYIQ